VSITIRPLAHAEWALFRDYQLHALKAEPGVFATSFEQNAARSPEDWQAMIADPAHQVFGLFDSEHLIGLTAALRWREDPSGQTVMFGMSFIAREYRGRGLSRLLYDARFEWVRSQPRFNRVVVSHRESNEPSRRPVQHYGFQPSGRIPTKWPDGETEDAIIYELWISRRSYRY
jgi:RimJ/RimL family protein N-acetyltransferase